MWYYDANKLIKNVSLFESFLVWHIGVTSYKSIYPDAIYVGIADGARTNWKFLENKTDMQITNFYHATEYLAKYSKAIFVKNQESKRKDWLDAAGCSYLIM